MNTHPTHTCVGRMGATAIDGPHRCRCFFLVCIVPSTPWRIDVFFRCICVFFVRFLERWCVCGRCFFVLSNIEPCQEFRGQSVLEIEAVHNLRKVCMYLNVLSLRSTS